MYEMVFTTAEHGTHSTKNNYKIISCNSFN